MSEINWFRVAETNGITYEEFTHQMTLVCISLLSIQLDEKPDADAIRVTEGGYVLTLSREQQP